ncbi:MAG: TPM domain-containing protein [Bacteroidales bacterium]|nr:TPM domain-containing protein [Bacteroidales bacterium]
MKRYLLIVIITVLGILGLSARTYTVDEIPNVHLQDSMRFVSNPDGILTAAAVAELDAGLKYVRRNTSAEAVIVVVDDIEGGDIDGFATELFDKWKLGKSDLDNGLLILVAKDLRRGVIRTGYGLEGVLPDITCGRILREVMFPRFRQGDYDGGITAAFSTISQILNDPANRDEILSREADADFAGGQDEDIDFFSVYLVIVATLTFSLLLVLIIVYAEARKKNRHERYVELAKLKPLYLAATFLGLGIPLVASLPLVIILYRLRNAPHKCAQCGTQMKKIDEVHDNEYLNHSQDLEEQIGSVDYDVWLCPNCGETDIEPYVNQSSTYKECQYCHARTAALRQNRIVRRPTTTREGQGVHDYGCLNCGHVTSVPYTIAKVAPAVPIVIVGGSGGRSGGGFGGGFGGGGFGGGMTGGGGASGGW